MKSGMLRAVGVMLLVGAAACSTVNKHVSKGFEAYQKFDYATAEIEFKKALEDDKDNMGALYQATGRPQLAVDYYKLVLESGKNIRPNRKTANLKTQQSTSSPTLAEIAKANLDAISAAAVVIKK